MAPGAPLYVAPSRTYLHQCTLTRLREEREPTICKIEIISPSRFPANSGNGSSRDSAGLSRTGINVTSHRKEFTLSNNHIHRNPSKNLLTISISSNPHPASGHTSYVYLGVQRSTRSSFQTNDLGPGGTRHLRLKWVGFVLLLPMSGM